MHVAMPRDARSINALGSKSRSHSATRSGGLFVSRACRGVVLEMIPEEGGNEVIAVVVS